MREEWRLSSRSSEEVEQSHQYEESLQDNQEEIDQDDVSEEDTTYLHAMETDYFILFAKQQSQQLTSCY